MITEKRVNKYGGKCRECGGYVAAGIGLLVGSKAEGWGWRSHE